MRGIRGCNPFKVLQIYVIVQKNYEQFPRLHYRDMIVSTTSFILLFVAWSEGLASYLEFKLCAMLERLVKETFHS